MSEGHDGESHASENGKQDRAGRSPDEGSGFPDKSKKKPRSSEVGRALRSVYDDTLREVVPDDFSDLLGKLS